MEGVGRLTELKRTIGKIEEPMVILITQVDPDALGASFGLKVLLEGQRAQWRDRVKIAYCGSIAHPQNRSIVNRFNLEKWLAPAGTWLFGKSIALVDSSNLKDSRLPESVQGLSPVIVIDHHRGSDIELSHERFVWIEDVGSSCTLVTELLEEASVTLDTRTSLLLALGIYNDTKALLATTARDNTCFTRLSSHFDHAQFARLLDFSLPTSHFNSLAHAIEHVERQEGRLVTTAGLLSANSGDDVAIIADYLLRLEGVTLVVVWSIIGGHVRISARTTDMTISLDRFLKDRFGEDTAGAKLTPDGRGEGGARISIEARPWLDADPAKMDPETLSRAIAFLSARIRELVFRR